MEGRVDLGYPAMHEPGVELTTSRSQVRRPNHYITELPRIWWCFVYVETWRVHRFGVCSVYMLSVILCLCRRKWLINALMHSVLLVDWQQRQLALKPVKWAAMVNIAESTCGQPRLPMSSTGNWPTQMYLENVCLYVENVCLYVESVCLCW